MTSQLESFTPPPESTISQPSLSAAQFQSSECRFDTSAYQRSSQELQNAGVLPALELYVDSSLKGTSGGPPRMLTTQTESTVLQGRVQANCGGAPIGDAGGSPTGSAKGTTPDAGKASGDSGCCGGDCGCEGCSGSKAESGKGAEGTGQGKEAEKALKDLFDQLDLNKKGSLSKEEITQGTVSQLLKFDSDDDGAINLQEAMAASKQAFGSELIGALAHTLGDANHDGKIDNEEMQKIGKQIADLALTVGDKDKDGKLGFDEFGGLFGKGGCNPPTDNPPTDNPPTDNPPTDNPPTDNPPTDNPPTDNPPTDNPPTDNPPTDKPPTDKPPTDKPGEVSKPTDAQIEKAFKQVENRGASDQYMQELKAAMKEMPAEFVQAFIDGKTKMVVYGQGPAGLGGTYDSGNNTITMYESAPFSTKGVLACEMAHNWDLNPYVGEHVTSEPWFQQAYAKAKASGISQGDNSYTNVYEFIHHMAKYYSDVHSTGVDQLMDYLGADYKKKTKEALAS